MTDSNIEALMSELMWPPFKRRTIRSTRGNLILQKHHWIHFL